MSTALSMPSPHGAFASSLQLSPAFRSLHAAALRQRQAEFERLRELARSDEFSDDESDGDEDEDELEDEEDPGDEQEADDAEDDQENQVAHASQEHERLSPRDAASDSDIDTDETVLLPFIRPTVSNSRASRAPHEALSPKADDWTIVDCRPSPTCEGVVFGKPTVSEFWFSRP